jgi:hypothetical protein
MNKLLINEKKVLSLIQDGKLYYDRQDNEGENNFAHCKLICAAEIVENAVDQLTVVLECLTTTVDSETSISNEISLTLSQTDDDEDVYVSDEFELGNDIICGVGRLGMFVRFTGTASKLGMTNSVNAKIYDVHTGSSETVFPKLGADLSKLDAVIERQEILNGRIGDLIG